MDRRSWHQTKKRRPIESDAVGGRLFGENIRSVIKPGGDEGLTTGSRLWWILHDSTSDSFEKKLCQESVSLTLNTITQIEILQPNIFLWQRSIQFRFSILVLCGLDKV